MFSALLCVTLVSALPVRPSDPAQDDLALLKTFEEWCVKYHREDLLQSVSLAVGEGQTGVLKTFRENLEFINKHNAEAEQGLHEYELGVNEFAHLSW